MEIFLKKSSSHAELSNGELIHMAEGALAAPWYRMSFPRVLETRFELDMRDARRRQLLILAFAGYFLYGGFLVTDMVAIPDVFLLAVKLRLGLIAAGLLLIPFVLRPKAAVWEREIMMPLFSVLAVASVMYLYVITSSTAKAVYPIGVTLITFYGALCLQPRFRYAAATCFLCLALIVTGLLLGRMPTAAHPAAPVSVGAVQTHLAVMVASIGFILATAFRLEREQRKTYLLRLREELRQRELLHSNAALLELSQRDSLTELASRRLLDERLADVWEQATDIRNIGLVMIDVDHFKLFNDTYGHQAGDDCLRAVASALSAQVRVGQDTIGRYGGEEFLAILPGQDLPGCLRVAERMRLAVERLAIPHLASLHGKMIGAEVLTVSMGVASAGAGCWPSTGSLLGAADSALYLAKRGGRNRVVASDASEMAVETT